MASTSGTCPSCHTKVTDKHCDSNTNPKCPWWRCMSCRHVFDSKGRINKVAK